jgi:transcriptional regulator with XRE-family HTH domain
MILIKGACIVGTFGENIFTARKRKGASQEEEAKYARVTKSTISKYERNEIMPSLDTAKLIADFLGTTLESLTGMEIPAGQTISIKDLKEVEGLPKSYIAAVKIAFGHQISPEELIKLIEVAASLKGGSR